MSSRLRIALVLVLLSALPVIAKNKKKPNLPDVILRAQTVYVVIPPDAGEPLTDPTANRTAEDAVEQAIMKWGRFRLVPGSQTADLIIAVRKGHAAGPTIRNSPADDRPVIIQPTGEAGTRAGGHQGVRQISVILGSAGQPIEGHKFQTR